MSLLHPRVVATGLTAYVTEDGITDIRNPATGLYPRFLNPRLVMTNNVDVSPDSFAVVAQHEHRLPFGTWPIEPATVPG